MTNPRHKVFISFQHGCQVGDKPCGVKFLTNPLSPIPMADFKECSGYCEKNEENPYQPVSICNYYDICGHYWKTRFEHLFSLSVDGLISKSVGDGDIGNGIKTDRNS